MGKIFTKRFFRQDHLLTWRNIRPGSNSKGPKFLPDSMLYLSATFFFLCGLCFGSFLNVIVYRLPKHLSLVSPPSRCPSCKRRLGVIDLVPLAGYLIIGGRCRSCGIKISPRYPLVELATFFLFPGSALPAAGHRPDRPGTPHCSKQACRNRAAHCLHILPAEAGGHLV